MRSCRSGHAAPVAMYASSIAMQSLKSRKTKMEWSRFDSASSGSAHGGTICVSSSSACALPCFVCL